MDYTKNYNLKKPSNEDFYNVEDFNSNVETVDNELKKVNDKADKIEKQQINKIELEEILSSQNILKKIKEVDGAGSGLDADTLDGKELSYFSMGGFGNNGETCREISGQNILDLKFGLDYPINGFFQGSNLINAPNSNTHVVRQIVIDSNNIIIQILERNLDSNWKQRKKIDGVWQTDWEELSILKKPVTVLYATLYLDEANGNDLNDGLTPSTALKTSNGLNNKLPLFLQNDMTVNIIGNFTNTLFINNILSSPLSSNRTLTIQGSTLNKANHKIFGIRINGCTSCIKFQYLNIGENVLNATNCLNVSIFDCGCNINNSSSSAIQNVSSNMIVENSSIINSGVCFYCSSGILVSKNNTGNATVSLRTFKGGIIFKSGTQPSGIESIIDGGAILEETRGNAIPTKTVINSGFANGWNGQLTYRKNQEGKCTVFFNLTKSTDIVDRETIYTLPLGFRPDITHTATCFLMRTDGTSLAFGVVAIDSQGAIKVNVLNGQTLTNVRVIYCIALDYYTS